MVGYFIKGERYTVKKEDITGIGCPYSSRKKNSPKGCEKDSPGFLGALLGMVAPLIIGGTAGVNADALDKSTGEAMLKKKESADKTGFSPSNSASEAAKYVPGKYGGKQTGPPPTPSIEDGVLSLSSLKKTRSNLG